MKPHLALRAVAPSLLALVMASAALAAPVVPPDFAVENALVGNILFNNPTAIATFPDGRWLVAEKRGVAWVVTNGVKSAKPLWSATPEVLNSGDRGLIGIAVDPAYAQNHRLYFFYTVDPDSDDVDDAVPAFARLTRYVTSADDSNVVDTTSRTILIGTGYRDGFTSASLSHGADCLRFGEDGSLLVSHGDGAHYEFTDAGGHDPGQFTPSRTDSIEDIGCFRAQFLGSLSGKVLRINPETGHGYASNPFVNGDLTSTPSKVWAFGFRNPFRFCVRPGTGAADTSAGRPGVIYAGDVGLNTWEEVNVLDRPGMNQGWPCREGRTIQPLFTPLRPTHHGCDTIDPTTLSDPVMTWHHNDSTLSVPYGLIGNCTAGGLFYDGTRYPAQYRGRMFFGDFGKGWLKVATLDSSQRVVQLQEFGKALDGPVDWAIDPVSGDVLYVSIYTGQVRRIRYLGTGQTELPPVARASATPTIGDAPAAIAFSSLGSYDPQGGAITCAWSFGDMSPVSTLNHPTHVYQSSGEYLAILSVANPLGRVTSDTVRIVISLASGFPAAGVLDSLTGPNRALAAPWVGSVSGIPVQDGALTQTVSPSYAVWNGATFGPNQEALVRFDSVNVTAPEHGLLLKVQGTSWSGGAVQIVYAATQSVVVVSTYTPGVGWTRRGGPWPMTFGRGDELGARAFSNGMVIVYKNHQQIGTASVLGWPYAESGGRVGLKLVGALGSRLVGFGGGDVPVTRRTPPRARILTPRDNSFFVAHQQITLSGEASDDEDAAGSLAFEWGIDLIHNNHTHPSVLTLLAPVDSFEAEDHDDGTGVSYRVHLLVTDPSGLSDTATVALFPEVDLAPTALLTSPDYPTGSTGITFAFTLANHGRMPAPVSRWAIVADNRVLAQGDTLIRAMDSVRVERTLPPLPPGAYTLRVVADTLGAVFETNESNNAVTRSFSVLEFPSTSVLDGFARSDGMLAAPWVGSLAGLSVRNEILVQTGSSNYAVWNGAVFGPDQEVFVRLDSITVASPEHDLLLKVQGTTWTAGAIQVGYSAKQGVVVVNTYTPGPGWMRRAGPWKASFGPGDQLGARAFANGTLRVYRNGQRIGEVSLTAWPYFARPGRIGLLLRDAVTSSLDDFGGGSLTAPRPQITSPSDRSFFVAGDRVVLRGDATDAEDPVDHLKRLWTVERVRGNQATATVLTSSAPSDSFVADAVDCVSYRVSLVVTDPAGLSGTATAALFPEIDLAPSPVVTAPVVPTIWNGVTFAFTLSNQGRVPAPLSRWAIVASGRILAQGDTLVPARASVRITRTLPPQPPGTYALRVIADTLGAIVETSESNNSITRSFSVLEFPSTAVLDGFARPDTALTAPWVGSLSGLAVHNRALVQNGTSSYAIWNGGVFGSDQEAFVRFDSVSVSAAEQCLLLKVQGPTWTAGTIQVTYSASLSVVVVNTYTPGQGWLRRAGPWKTSFVIGDQLGVRAMADGAVRVYKNGLRIGEVSLATWPFANKGGRLGILLSRANGTRIVAFGGGDRRPDSAMSGSGGLRAGGSTMELENGIPPVLALSNAFPNPSRSAVTFALDLPHAARVSLDVYDVQGRAVWREPERTREAGRWQLHWPGRDRAGNAVHPGVYLVHATIDGRVMIRRVAVTP